MYTIFINDSVLILRSFESILEVDEKSEIQIYSSGYSMNSAIAKVQNGLYKSLILQGVILNICGAISVLIIN